jgi:hypothetical protein
LIVEHAISDIRQIGVTGHRKPPKLPFEAMATLRRTVDHILVVLHHPEDGGRVVVSSVAEGADRIVADAGLAAGWELKVILPFDREEYEKDFATDASLADFRRLLAEAHTIVELPGLGTDRPPAYEAAGFAMLEHLDLLIAIWDGQPAAGRGGSAEIVAAAIDRQLSVAWIDPSSPAHIRLTDFSRQPCDELKDVFVAASPQTIAVALEGS